MFQKRIRFEFGMIKFRSSLQQKRDQGASYMWFWEPSLSNPSDEISDAALESKTEQETQEIVMIDKVPRCCGLNEAHRVPPVSTTRTMPNNNCDKIVPMTVAELAEQERSKKQAILEMFGTKSTLNNYEDDASESSDCCEQISLEEADSLWDCLVDVNEQQQQQ